VGAAGKALGENGKSPKCPGLKHADATLTLQKIWQFS